MKAWDSIGDLQKGLDRVVVGMRWEKEILLATMIANGHILLEGVPGIAKTTMVRALARLMGLTTGWDYELGGTRFRGFSRIQFTPDLLPGDVTGSLVFDPERRTFTPHPGPIFAYLVLADEINRATPRTQSALLEAMQERQVTIGEWTYRLEDRARGKWFLVVATQNPVEQEGTYPLPEAQLDRFTVRILVGYPASLEEEKSILRLHLGGLAEPVEALEPVVDPGWLVRAQEEALEVGVPDGVLEEATRIVRATRPEVYEPARRFFQLGASPRAGIALVRAARALAYLRGEDVVSRESLRDMVFPVLNHRVVPDPEALVEYEERYGLYTARVELIREGLRSVMESVS
ncbi:MAG: AAA family ATPase [Desulfurococcales archaeon]|nr:AAA family ATPase [Desulfurococcales archaeon]